MEQETPKPLSPELQSLLEEKILPWLRSQKSVSISKLQREFSIGFPRAVALIKELEANNLIRPNDKYGYEVLVYEPHAPLKIALLDINPEMATEFKKAFEGVPNVEVFLDDFAHFLGNHPEVDGVVSPANSFGYMDGGYDLAITRYFGTALEKKVQAYIKENLYGEQPVGTSLCFDIPGSNKKLIHTPTMRVPSPIVDPFVLYQCMRTTLMCALDNKLTYIVVPAFGGATGKVKPKTIAYYMRKGYDQVFEYANKAN